MNSAVEWPSSASSANSAVDHAFLGGGHSLPQRARRTRRGLRESVDEAANAVLEQLFVKVDEQSDAATAKLQVGQHLSREE